MNRKIVVGLVTVVAAAAGAGSVVLAAPPGRGQGGQKGPRAPGSTTSLTDAQRSAAGYDWSELAALDAQPGAVSAMALAPQGLLAAHAPKHAICLVDMVGAVTTEVTLAGPVSAISPGGVFASAAGDVHLRTGGMWAPSLDTPDAVSLVATSRRAVIAAVGSPGQDGQVHELGRRGWEAGALLPGGLPTAIAAGGRQALVGCAPSGGSGPALLFEVGRRGAAQVSLPAPTPALATGEREQVDVLLSLDAVTLVALGVYDAAGAAVRGSVLLVSDGRRSAPFPVASFPGEVVLSAVEADGSVYLGTSMGRLLHLAAGQWTDEPGLPVNDGVTTLLLEPASGTLLVGVRSAAGPKVLTRRPKSSGTPTPPPPPPPATAPVAPANLVAVAPAATKVDLTWTDASSDETGFAIERAPAGMTTFTRVGVAAQNATAWSDTMVSPATAYDYRVLAVNAAGASAPSNTATVTTPAASAAPTYLADVKPILAGKNLLNVSCAGCHTNRSYQLSAGLTDDTADYTSTLGQINTVSPANSELLLRATMTKGHPLKLLDVGSPEYDTILRWIQGGAKFN